MDDIPSPLVGEGEGEGDTDHHLPTSPLMGEVERLPPKAALFYGTKNRPRRRPI